MADVTERVSIMCTSDWKVRMMDLVVQWISDTVSRKTKFAASQAGSRAEASQIRDLDKLVTAVKDLKGADCYLS